MKPIAQIKDVRERFVAFIIERENCRLAKEMGIYPHTQDLILRVNRFCNVNREHDAVTRWVKTHVRDRDDLNHRQMVLNLLVARIFNNPNAIQHVIPCHDLDRCAIRLNAMRRGGQSVFRGAYMMVVHGDAGKGKNAIDFYCNLVKNVDMLGIGDRVDNLAFVADLISSVTGLGRFMANQIVTDLRYTRFYPPEATKDWETFLWSGPGTLRGVRRYYGLDIDSGREPDFIKGTCLTHKQAPAIVLRLRDELRGQFPIEIQNHFKDPNNLSNCFCEFDKYERVLGMVPSTKERKATLRKYTPTKP
jgi:hypothetical protein